jgi:MFS transporter, NNP family, nitrate/nitrite transporter
MNLRDFRRAGHLPTLFCAFLYFDISFMVWVILGALANAIVLDLDLSPAQKGLMVAVPLLGGALLRIPLGVLTDRIGGRRAGMLGLALTAVPLVLGWLWADQFSDLMLVGLLLGVAGASFAVALPLASRWYPPKYQGLAMGIAGAGNSGTALASLFGPALAEALGWHAVFGLTLLPVGLTLAVFALLAKDSPDRPAPKPPSAYGAVLRRADTWWFCLFYAVTFGGFVGLASFLGIYFHDGHGLGRISAGYFTTLCVVAGSLLRPVGGYLSDRFGGLRLLATLYLGVGLVMLGVAGLPAAGVGGLSALALATALLFLGMGLLGMGNGAVFQLVPQRFPREIGAITGVVGAAGGAGGFFLPTLLGGLKGWTGSFAGGFLVFGLLALGCVVALRYVGRSWEGGGLGPGGRAAESGAAGLPPEPWPSHRTASCSRQEAMPVRPASGTSPPSPRAAADRVP